MVTVEEGTGITDLRSLGINPGKMTEFNDKKELEGLADILKQSMLQDYRMAYSGIGQKYEAESKATVNP
jgi:hypothetical protein